jgi:hypothetical protein
MFQSHWLPNPVGGTASSPAWRLNARLMSFLQASSQLLLPDLAISAISPRHWLREGWWAANHSLVPPVPH